MYEFNDNYGVFVCGNTIRCVIPFPGSLTSLDLQILHEALMPRLNPIGGDVCRFFCCDREWPVSQHARAQLLNPEV